MSAALSIAAIKDALLRVGYDASYFHDNLPLTNGRTVPVVAFAGHPFDAVLYIFGVAASIFVQAPE